MVTYLFAFRIYGTLLTSAATDTVECAVASSQLYANNTGTELVVDLAKSYPAITCNTQGPNAFQCAASNDTNAYEDVCFQAGGVAVFQNVSLGCTYDIPGDELSVSASFSLSEFPVCAGFSCDNTEVDSLIQHVYPILAKSVMVENLECEVVDEERSDRDGFNQASVSGEVRSRAGSLWILVSSTASLVFIYFL